MTPSSEVGGPGGLEPPLWLDSGQSRSAGTGRRAGLKNLPQQHLAFRCTGAA